MMSAAEGREKLWPAEETARFSHIAMCKSLVSADHHRRAALPNEPGAQPLAFLRAEKRLGGSLRHHRRVARAALLGKGRSQLRTEASDGDARARSRPRACSWAWRATSCLTHPVQSPKGPRRVPSFVAGSILYHGQEASQASPSSASRGKVQGRRRCQGSSRIANIETTAWPKGWRGSRRGTRSRANPRAEIRDRPLGSPDSAGRVLSGITQTARSRLSSHNETRWNWCYILPSVLTRWQHLL
jgi:hypothetical protein